MYLTLRGRVQLKFESLGLKLASWLSNLVTMLNLKAV